MRIISTTPPDLLKESDALLGFAVCVPVESRYMMLLAGDQVAVRACAPPLRSNFPLDQEETAHRDALTEKKRKIPAEFDETKTIIKSDRIGGLT
jgi:hypothetical protein